MYEKHIDIHGEGAIHEPSTGKWIPLDQANTDYQQYLAWVAEGNEPEVVTV